MRTAIASAPRGTDTHVYEPTCRELSDGPRRIRRPDAYRVAHRRASAPTTTRPTHVGNATTRVRQLRHAADRSAVPLRWSRARMVAVHLRQPADVLRAGGGVDGGELSVADR